MHIATAIVRYELMKLNNPAPGNRASGNLLHHAIKRSEITVTSNLRVISCPDFFIGIIIRKTHQERPTDIPLNDHYYIKINRHQIRINLIFSRQ